MTSLREDYETRRDKILLPLAHRLETHLKTLFEKCPRIDRIAVRVKDVDRFVGKAEKVVNGQKKYGDPFNQIHDQLGARIVTFYKTDVEFLANEVKKYFRYIESRRIIPDSESEFGYEGRHFILFVPQDVIDDGVGGAESVDFFELQIKTLFQHAWSEAGHDLGYKPPIELTSDQKRHLAFTAAQAWGADHIFNELHQQATSAL